MLILISPAKTFDFNSSLNFKENTKPLFEAGANKLVKYLIHSENGIKELWIFPIICKHQYGKVFNFHNLKNNKLKQAIFAFNGDVYESLNVKVLTVKSQVSWTT